MRALPAPCVLLMAALSWACAGGSTTGGTCADAWSKASAACPAAATTSLHEQFIQECDHAASFPGCGPQANAFADCVKQASSFTCDANGQPHGVGCDAQEGAFANCVLGPLGGTSDGVAPNSDTGVTVTDASASIGDTTVSGMDAASIGVTSVSGMDASAPNGDTSVTGMDASAPNGETSVTGMDASATGDCQELCTIAFASGPDWPSFEGSLTGDGGTFTTGASLGAAKEVCVTPAIPSNCPVGDPSVVIYQQGSASGWGGGSQFPQAHWIWRGDVAPTAPADLQVAIFQQTYSLGASPSGFIQVAVDDLAEVFVNDVPIGSIGSVADVTIAYQAQNAPRTFDLTPALRSGSNTLTVVSQNGPASFAGGCGAAGCTYAQNTAGVVFAGSLSWR